MNSTSPSSKPRRSLSGIVTLLFSIGAGAGGVYFSQEYIAGQVASQTTQHSVEEVMVTVVVAARDMLRGDVVYESDLLERDIPEQYVDSNTVTGATYELALGQRIDFDIDKGRPLLWAHLAGGITPTFSGKVDQGLRAMTVRVDDINSISGFLQPGDRVDLLMSYGSGTKQRILSLMEQLNVIATGVQTETDKVSDGGRRDFSTITVHVTPADARKLTLAQQVGKLTAILRHPDDIQKAADAPLSVAQLIASSSGVTTPKLVKRRPRKAEEPQIQYIIGGQ